MFKVLSVSVGFVAHEDLLENELNNGWRIHDKTAVQDRVIYILWKDTPRVNHPSGSNN